ncbi:hypothetical protein L3Q82_007525 [Scortum barcoo]|uniref:Uncharacterized protein n=1 Tax=Scortum barcoo TaxID=214431 RepID=A0ACB8WN78_9TELE|nr:hypothetical protein L3Q82_007525 [Scortum barcoo]
MSLGWPGNASGSPRKSWRKCLGLETVWKESLLSDSQIRSSLKISLGKQHHHHHSSIREDTAANLQEELLVSFYQCSTESVLLCRISARQTQPNWYIAYPPAQTVNGDVFIIRPVRGKLLRRSQAARRHCLLMKSPGQTLADYMYRNCGFIFKENHVKPLMLPVCYISNTLVQKATTTSELAAAFAVLPEDILSAVVWCHGNGVEGEEEGRLKGEPYSSEITEIKAGEWLGSAVEKEENSETMRNLRL